MAGSETKPNIVSRIFRRLEVEPVIVQRKTFGTAVILGTAGVIFTASGVAEIGNTVISAVQNQAVRDLPDTIINPFGKIIAGTILMIMGKTGIQESLKASQVPQFHSRVVRKSRSR